MSANAEKKKVNDIVVENLLEMIEKNGYLPWQMPYKMYNSFNWYSKHIYRGINRLLLPFGEYITMKQLIEYNKKEGTNYRVEKGLPWQMVVYSKDAEVKVPLDKLNFPMKPGDVVYTEAGQYIWKEGEPCPVRKYFFMRYSKVIEREFVKDPDSGKVLPSKIEDKEVTLTNENPQKIINDYLAREKGLKVRQTRGGIPKWSPMKDVLTMNLLHEEENEYYSTFFHELAHSTSHETRLNRSFGSLTDKEAYAKEECVAELTSALLCAEAGLYDPDEMVESTKTRHGVQTNQAAYLKSWIKQIRDWRGSFLSLVHEADRAFYYILGQEGDYNKKGDQR